MVCDYRTLNKIAVAGSNPLPLIHEALDQVSGAKVFSKIDLLGAYHQMRIKEDDCKKPAIRTRFGSLEWRELCFGLTNAPAAFTLSMSSLVYEMNGECLVLFLDGILVYSKSVEEHKEHLRRVFEILRKNGLYAKKSKCEFGVSDIEFLGHHVNANGVSMTNRLVTAILDWPAPKTIRDVQSFWVWETITVDLSRALLEYFSLFRTYFEERVSSGMMTRIQHSRRSRPLLLQLLYSLTLGPMCHSSYLTMRQSTQFEQLGSRTGTQSRTYHIDYRIENRRGSQATRNFSRS